MDKQVPDSFPSHLRRTESTTGCNNQKKQKVEDSHVPEVKQIHWLFSSTEEYLMNCIWSHDSTENPSVPQTENFEESHSYYVTVTRILILLPKPFFGQEKKGILGTEQFQKTTSTSSAKA